MNPDDHINVILLENGEQIDRFSVPRLSGMLPDVNDTVKGSIEERRKVLHRNFVHEHGKLLYVELDLQPKQPQQQHPKPFQRYVP